MIGGLSGMKYSEYELQLERLDGRDWQSFRSGRPYFYIPGNRLYDGGYRIRVYAMAFGKNAGQNETNLYVQPIRPEIGIDPADRVGRNQMPLAETVNLPDGLVAHTVKGGELIVGHSPSDDFYSGQTGAHLSDGSEHKLEMSPDGKSAKITSRITGRLKFDLSNDGAVAMTTVGHCAFTQEFTFDLSGDEPKLVDYHFGQTFDA